jgi:hypothetical protein
VNPFPGLAIDADVWRDAHNYNRDQQRLHNLVFHQTGIIEGLEVTSREPPDLSVDIHPGLAVDPQGYLIFVRNIYHYELKNHNKGTVYLIIQFREIPEGPYQPPEGGQPTRIVDGYRIQERTDLPDEPYLELARIEMDPNKNVIKDAKNGMNPGWNEINLGFRKTVTKSPAAQPSEESGIIFPGIAHPKPGIKIGYASLDGTDDGRHLKGLRNIAREIKMKCGWAVEVKENLAFDMDISKYTMIYLTARDNFRFTEGQLLNLKEVFLKSNGLLLIDECSESETNDKKAKKRNPVFEELANQFKIELKPVQRDDPLLSNVNVFSEVPLGMKSGLFLKGGGVIYTNHDYGCACQGGHKDFPLSRDDIRSALEIGTNIVYYAHCMKTSASENKPL